MDSKINDDHRNSFSMIVKESNCTDDENVQFNHNTNSPKSGKTILIEVL